MLAQSAENPEPRGRLALVVGNWDYAHLASLKNPGPNSELVAQSLRTLGFDVSQRPNLTKKGFEAAIKDISGRAPGYESVLFYFSGHGLQLEGRNFLVPVDAKLGSPKRLRDETIAFEDLVSQIHDIGRQTLFFLDASGPSPIPKSTNAGKRESGLAQIEQVRGTFVAFAAEPGAVADEGQGEASPFSLALAESMETEGISISDMMIRVRNTVEEQTQQQQTPWDQSSLRSQFYFKPLIENSESLTEDDLGLLTQLDPVLLDKFQKRFGLDLSGDAGGAGAPVIATVRPTLRIEEADPEEAVSEAENVSKQQNQPDAVTAAAEYETVKPGILILGADDAGVSGENAMDESSPAKVSSPGGAAPAADGQLAMAAVAAAQQAVSLRNLRAAEAGQPKLPSTQIPGQIPGRAAPSSVLPRTDTEQPIPHQKNDLPPKSSLDLQARKPLEGKPQMTPQVRRAPETAALPAKASPYSVLPKPETSAESKLASADKPAPAGRREPEPPMSARAPETAARTAADRQPLPLPKPEKPSQVTLDAVRQAFPASKNEQVISAPRRESEIASQTAKASQAIPSPKPMETAQSNLQLDGKPEEGSKPETVFRLPQAAPASPQQAAKADPVVFPPAPGKAETAKSQAEDKKTAGKPFPAAPRAAPANPGTAPKPSAAPGPAALPAAESASAAPKSLPPRSAITADSGSLQNRLGGPAKPRAESQIGLNSLTRPPTRVDAAAPKLPLPLSGGDIAIGPKAAPGALPPQAEGKQSKESAAQASAPSRSPDMAAAVKTPPPGAPKVQAPNSFGLAPTPALASAQPGPTPAAPAGSAGADAGGVPKSGSAPAAGGPALETAFPGSIAAPKDTGVQMAAIDPSNPRYSPLAPAQEPSPEVSEPNALAPEQEAPGRREFALRAQQELQRLGCYRSALDGNWSARSARALLRYYAERKINPDEVEPSQKLIDLLSSEQTVVCKTTKAPAKPKKLEPKPSATVSKPKAAPVTRKPAAKVKPAPAVKAAPPKPKIVATTKTAPPKPQVKSPIAKPITGLFR